MSCCERPRPLTRREALAKVGGGFGLLALANMVNRSMANAAPAEGGGLPGALPQLHFKPRAKRVIFLFMNGGMSHVDTFDPKPMLEKYDGQPLPGGAILTQRKTGNLMKSPFKFARYGKADTEVSELWQNVGGISEEICVIRSMYADIPNHEPCMCLMNTGAKIIGRPSMGFLDHLWSGEREFQPAWLRSAVPIAAHHYRQPAVELGVPAGYLPGYIRQERMGPRRAV